MSSSTPLLNSGNEVVESNEICLKKLIDVNEAKIQILFSVPMILTNLATYAVPLVSVMFAGHLGHLELAGATLANSWGIVTGFALMVLSPFLAFSNTLYNSYFAVLSLYFRNIFSVIYRTIDFTYKKRV